MTTPSHNQTTSRGDREPQAPGRRRRDECHHPDRLDDPVYLRYVDRARAAGVDIPIVPDVLPVTTVAQTRRFAAQVGASVPAWLDGLFDGLDADPQTRDLVAASVASEQCADLATQGVRHIHFSTLNRAALTYSVCRLLAITAARPAA